MSYINHSDSPAAKGKAIETLVMTQDQPLRVRTHNLGFTTSGMSTLGDLRPPATRAEELVQSILHDPLNPDVILFQETFHEDGARILAEGLKEEYPYLIHSVAPQIGGFSSAAMVASKYPIERVEFHRLNHMTPGPERAAPRGISSVRLNSAKGSLLLYGVHTQALLGEMHAKARFNQVRAMVELIQKDRQEEPGVLQVLMGDLNTSRVTAWGEDNLLPQGQAEEAVLKEVAEHFDDIYERDHHPLTGERTYGEPTYLPIDNARLEEEALVEPSGSWYHGPFANPGFILSAKMKRDREKHGRPVPNKVAGISVKPATWGSSDWHAEQTANTARFDYILLPKGDSPLEGRAEIRRVVVPKGIQSASSDHLPVDGRIWHDEAVFLKKRARSAAQLAISRLAITSSLEAILLAFHELNRVSKTDVRKQILEKYNEGREPRFRLPTTWDEASLCSLYPIDREALRDLVRW